MDLTLLLLLPSPSSIGRVQWTSPWHMVFIVATLMEVVGEEGKEGVLLTLLLLQPSPCSIGAPAGCSAARPGTWW